MQMIMEMRGRCGRSTGGTRDPSLKGYTTKHTRTHTHSQMHSNTVCVCPQTLCVFALRAIYFAAYSSTKEQLNTLLEPDSTQVHMLSAGLAGNAFPHLFVCLPVCLNDH